MRPSYRLLRIVGIVGLAVLAVSTAGAIFALNPKGTVPAAGNASEQPARGGGPVVCYGYADVESGVTPLYPMVPGRVVEVKVTENKVVQKGDPLIRLDDRLARLRQRQADEDYKAAMAQVSQAKKLPEQYQAKTAQQEAAIQAMDAKLAGARLILEEKKKLLKDKLIKPVEVSAGEEQIKELEAAVRVEQAKLRELGLFDPSIQLKRAEAEEAAKKAQLDQAQLALDECTLSAPTDGQILQILIGTGSILTGHPSQPAILFAPAGKRIVRAEVEQEFANRLVEGQSVVVQDEHGSGGIRHGKILRIADWYTRPRSQMQIAGPIVTNEVRTLECIVTLDPGQASFRLGQRVRVTAGKAAE
jgi:multidrug resistance efflux pump